MKRIFVILLLLITFNSIAQNKTVVLKVASSDISNYKLISDTGFNNGYTTRVRLKQGLDSLAATEKNVSDSLFNSGYTRRDRTKQGLDSVGVLKVNFTDTATMLSPYARNYSVVKYTDTSTMLSPYQRSFSAVKYTDTATMLSGYKTYYPRAALSSGTGISYNTTTGVITNTSPSSGGTVTSVATNTGSGITGGTITVSGTIAADTTVLSTKANVTALLLRKVSSVTGTSPIVSSGGTTPAISIPAATTSVNGYLTSTDWNTFNNKASTASLANYLPLAGGTLTGALNGTSAAFSSTVTVGTGTSTIGGSLYMGGKVSIGSSNVTAASLYIQGDGSVSNIRSQASSSENLFDGRNSSGTLVYSVASNGALTGTSATFSSLAGTGTRMVVASSTGELSTQAIAGGTDGTYTPTLTNVSNTSSLTGNNVTYTKVGSTYHISMLATITATTVGTCQFTISIPSTINNATQRSNGLAIGLNGEVGTLVYNSTTSLICKFVSLFASVPTTLSIEFDYSEN